jgi:hypothetical protein
MRAQRFNLVSTIGLVVLSLTALLTVLPFALRAMLGLPVPPPPGDEGAGAHIFQISIVALMPMGLFFLATADWTQPSRIVKRLALPALFVALAFCILYSYEHHYLLR